MHSVLAQCQDKGQVAQGFLTFPESGPLWETAESWEFLPRRMGVNTWDLHLNFTFKFSFIDSLKCNPCEFTD